MDDIGQILARSDRLIENRRPYEALWLDVRNYLYPDGPAASVQETEGARNRDRIVTNRGENALDQATAKLFALLCNPATMWKEWVPQDPDLVHDHNVRDALERANELSFRAVYLNPRSRFSVSMLQFIREFLALGTACLYVARRTANVPLIAARAMAQIAAGENDDFEPDEITWRFQYTARQAMLRWPDYPGVKLRAAAERADSANEKFWFRHCVWPRSEAEGYDRQSARPEKLAYADYWICEEERALCAKPGGHYDQPYVLARENQRPGELYGRGRGGKSLDDVKMLQRARRTVIQGAETVVRPPMIRPDDASVNSGGKLLLRPGWENVARPEFFMRGIDPVRPIITNARVDLGLEFEQAIGAEIDTPLLKQVMNLPREARMPVDHVLALEEESLQVAAPLVEILQAEALAPLDARIFGIMQRDGAFEDIFESLGVAVSLRAEFKSPAARIMRLKQARAAAQRRQLFGDLFKVKPELLDVEDFITAYRETGDILGVPARWDFSPEKFEEMQAARAEEAQAREAREAGKDVTTMAKNAAPMVKAVAEQQQQAA